MRGTRTKVIVSGAVAGSVTEDVYAGYLMGNVQLGALTATGGVRLESTSTTSERYRFVNDETLENAVISLQKAGNSYVDLLQSHGGSMIVSTS